MNDSGDLYFVYLGNRLPKYAIPSLRLAVKHSGMNIVLIGNAVLEELTVGCDITFISTESFYDNSDFLRISKNLINNPTFREGFWLKTLERFFVIEQYMKFKGLNSLLHGELDQLFFGLEDLDARLKLLVKDGLYLPLRDAENAVPSIIYIRNPDSLTSLLKYAKTSLFHNEMRLISDWGNENPSMIFGLPTLASELISYSELGNIRIIESEIFNGIFDAAQLGQWVSGIDPRNVPVRTKPVNKVVDIDVSSMLSKAILSDLIFKFREDDNSLFVEHKDSSRLRLYNLHIHSKIHSNLLSCNPGLIGLFDSVNKVGQIYFAGTRKVQLVSFVRYYFFCLNIALSEPSKVRLRISRVRSRMKREFNLRFNRRRSSKPFISGDSFRAMSDLVLEKSGYSFEIKDVKQGSVIFCESDCIVELHRNILSNLSSEITLILGNSDQNHGEDYRYLKENPYVKKIFAQNLLAPMKGFFPLPIGLENLWWAENGRVSDFKRLMRVNRFRKPRIMWTFSTETNPQVRRKSFLELSEILTADKFSRVSSSKHRRLLSTYSFIASPPGNGLDTHRTWEAMYLGCVPIVLRSYMTEFYLNLGLPVWVIDTYSDLEAFDERDLEKKYKEFKPLFQNEALWLKYWENLINQ